MTADDFKRIALSLPGAEEGSHFGNTDFRVGGKIFATLSLVKQGFGVLMLSPEAADRLQVAGIDRHVRAWEKPSDHVPVWIELDLEAK